jgi:hypothetical protein
VKISALVSFGADFVDARDPPQRKMENLSAFFFGNNRVRKGNARLAAE